MKNKPMVREKHVIRATHRLFWSSMLHFKTDFFLSLFQIPYFFMFNVYVPLQTAYAIQAIVERRFDDITPYIVNMVVGLVISIVAFAIGNLAFNRHGVKNATLVVERLFENYLNKDYEFFADHHIGALGAYAGRMRQAANDYARIFMFDGLRTATIVFASLAVVFYQSPILALVAIACVFIVLSSTFAAHSYRVKFRRVASEAEGKLAGILGDALSHGTVVKTFATQRYELGRLKPTLKEWAKAQRKTWDLAVPIAGIRNMTLVATMAILLIVSARMYEAGEISFAVIVLVQLYVIRLVSMAVDIADIIKLYDQAMGAAYMPVATMLEPRHVTDAPAAVKLGDSDEYVLTLDNVSFAYDGQGADRNALSGLNLEVKPGEKIGLVGYSGSGKTTLSKLLLRFMDPTKGAIAINGHVLTDITQESLRKHVAYVPQEPLLFHRDIWDNIAYGDPNASKGQIEKAAKLAYVDEFVDELPEGYRTKVGERGVKLSGGQRQRVAIARAILKDAPMLVLDEATSALDSRSEQLIQKALWELMKGRTAIVIAHRLSTIQKMDRIVVMDKGKIVQLGTHEELLKDSRGIYAELWSHQSGGYIGGASTDEEN